MLIELGATQLIELGTRRFRMGSVDVENSPVLDVFKTVAFFEDPYAGMPLEPGEYIDPRARAVAERLRTVSRQARHLISNPSHALSGFMENRSQLLAALQEIVNDVELGKSKIGKRLKKVAHKVIKVVKSPAFLSVVGLAANLIPGVGQVASAALMATAAYRAKKDQEKKEKKEFKKQTKAAAAMYAEEIERYYKENEAYFVFWGYTPQVWSTFDQATKIQVLEAAGQGVLKPYDVAAVVAASPAAQQQVVQAAAMSQAMQQTYPNLPGQGVQAPPQLQSQVNSAASEYQRQIAATGVDNFYDASQKLVGQAGAINAFYEGTGAQLPGGVSDVLSQVSGGALKAGIQDLENAGAAVGEQGKVNDILGRGLPSDLVIPIVAVTGGIVVVVGTLALVGAFR